MTRQQRPVSGEEAELYDRARPGSSDHVMDTMMGDGGADTPSVVRGL